MLFTHCQTLHPWQRASAEVPIPRSGYGGQYLSSFSYFQNLLGFMQGKFTAGSTEGFDCTTAWIKAFIEYRGIKTISTISSSAKESEGL